MKYTALMIDVVDSRLYKDREKIQIFLKMIIDFLNIIYFKSLIKPLMFSAGDEVQGLFSTPASAYLCARFFIMICYPVKVRVGIGYGELAYYNDEWDSTEMDGKAYYNARDAINNFEGKDNLGVRINRLSKFDKMINALLYSSQLIQTQQSISGRDVNLMAELIYPIFDNEIMDPYMSYSTELTALLKIREDLLNDNSKIVKLNTSSSSKQIQKVKYNLEYLNTIENIIVPLSEIIYDDSLIIGNTWKKGMSTAISEILNSTRQNIDHHIRFGKVEEIRKIDYTIVYSLSEELSHE